jgi:hypothetical protein
VGVMRDGQSVRCPMISTVKDLAYCERIADIFALRLLQGDSAVECFRDCLAEYFDAADHINVKRLFARACTRRIGNAVEETEFIRSASKVIAEGSFERRLAEKEMPLPVTKQKTQPWWRRIFSPRS